MFENSSPDVYRGYRMEDFRANGRNCNVVFPETPAAGGKWIWRAEFLGAFDTVDLDLLSKGYTLACCQVHDMYGCPEAVEAMKSFHDLMTAHGFSEKTVIFGFSRGGLYACNYALRYPGDIAALYLDAPVLDIKSWPGGMMTGVGAAREFDECLALYGLDRETVKDFRQNPVDRLGELLELKIPVALVAGDSDRVVPYCENGKYLEEVYRNGGGDLLCIVKPGCDHHPHSLTDPAPVSGFITARY